MILVFCLYCVLQLIIRYYCVYGDGAGDEFQRYIVEDGFKPAIFGSYSYDPVRQVFDPPPAVKKNVSMSVNVTGISTKIGDITERITLPTTTPDTPEARLRERINMLAVKRSSTTATTHWWARAKSTQTTRWAYKNLTSLLKNML